MSSPTLREQAQAAQAAGEQQLALAAKLNEAADLADQVGGVTTAPTTGKKRGRKAGSKNKNTEGKSTGTTTGGRGRRNGAKSMKEVVVQVLKGKKKGLSLADIVSAVLASGYETKSKKPAEVVYQAVYKLMKDEGISDDQRVEKEGDNYRLQSAA